MFGKKYFQNVKMPYGEKNLIFFLQMFLKHLPSYDKVMGLAAKLIGFMFYFCRVLALEKLLGWNPWTSVFSSVK